MRRLIQKEIEDPLSMEILAGKNEHSNLVSVDYVNDELRVRFVKPRQAKVPATVDGPLVNAVN